MGMSWGNSISSFKNMSRDTGKNTKRSTQRIVDEVSRLALADVMSFTPMKTGRLRSGWRMKKGRSGENRMDTIENNVDYAVPVEHGTNRKKPRLMLKRAMNKAAVRLRRRLKREMKRTAQGFNS